MTSLNEKQPPLWIREQSMQHSESGFELILCHPENKIATACKNNKFI